MRNRILSLLVTLALTVGMLVLVGAMGATADEFLRLPFYVFFPGISFFLCLLCLLSLRQLWSVGEQRTTERYGRIARTRDLGRIKALWNDILTHFALSFRALRSWQKRLQRSAPITVQPDSLNGADIRAKAAEATTAAYRRLEALRARASRNDRFVLRSVVFRPATAMPRKKAER
jgi:hypothetical protein